MASPLSKLARRESGARGAHLADAGPWAAGGGGTGHDGLGERGLAAARRADENHHHLLPGVLPRVRARTCTAR